MSRESKATKEEIQRNRDEAYQNGWGDGYAEGYGKATEDAIRALPAASSEDVRAGALREALEAMRGAGSAGRTKAERKAALEQYCLDRDAILALIPGAKP